MSKQFFVVVFANYFASRLHEAEKPKSIKSIQKCFKYAKTDTAEVCM